MFKFKVKLKIIKSYKEFFNNQFIIRIRFVTKIYTRKNYFNKCVNIKIKYNLYKHQKFKIKYKKNIQKYLIRLHYNQISKILHKN